MRWFVLFICSCKLFAGSSENILPSSPEEIASLNADLLIDGYVSAISGQLMITEKDLHVKGAQDLLFTRTYIAPQILGRYEDNEQKNNLVLGRILSQMETKGWQILPQLWVVCKNIINFH